VTSRQHVSDVAAVGVMQRYVSWPCGVYGRQEVVLSTKCARWTPLYAVIVSSDNTSWSLAAATPPRVWAGGRVGSIDTISEPTEIDLTQRAFNPLKIYGFILSILVVKEPVRTAQ